jgi:hypothetical protein
VFTFAHNTRIYHLCTRPLYRALGQEDNRNRRERQPLTIKNKLMGLDFVLAHSAQQFLVTEQEKVDYFTGALNVDVATLPAKLFRSRSREATTTRYFVDKYPIFLPAATSDTSPVVSFCFVDEGLTTASRFETYLHQYSPLFAALPRFHVIYVAATQAPFQWAERTFERFLVRRNDHKNSRSLDPVIGQMLDHFAARERFESKDLAAFDRSKLIRFRNDREQFSGEKYEFLYAAWKTGGKAAVLPILAPERRPEVESQAMFSTYVLRHNYDFFGTLTTF